MTGEWSEWVPVADWLDRGWNFDPMAPYDKGVYRFRVKAGHRERSKEVVYIGRAGSHDSGKNTPGVCARIGSFITAAMGFWTFHLGGEKFYKTAADDAKKIAGHQLSARDLEVSWALDDDPKCREAEELKCFGKEKPAFNTDDPQTCEREDCARRRKLLEKPCL
jgi:hypothetical protein